PRRDRPRAGHHGRGRRVHGRVPRRAAVGRRRGGRSPGGLPCGGAGGGGRGRPPAPPGRRAAVLRRTRTSRSAGLTAPCGAGRPVEPLGTGGRLSPPPAPGGLSVFGAVQGPFLGGVPGRPPLRLSPAARRVPACPGVRVSGR